MPNPPGPGHCRRDLPGRGRDGRRGDLRPQRATSSVRREAPGYGAGADRTVLLRWYSSEPDPVVKPGDWIADVTYERNAADRLQSRSRGTAAGSCHGRPAGRRSRIPFNNNEWDNLPAQRCFWYQVQKVTPAIDDPYTRATIRRCDRWSFTWIDRSRRGRS